MNDLTSREKELWLAGVERVVRAFSSTTDAFAIWSETIHHILKVEGRCSCGTQLCWVRFSPHQQRERLKGSLISYEALLERIETVVCDQSRRQ